MLQQGMEGLRGLGRIVERIQDPRELVLLCWLSAEEQEPWACGKVPCREWGEEAGVRRLHGGRGCKAGSWRVLMLSVGAKHYMGGRLWVRQGGEK